MKSIRTIALALGVSLAAGAAFSGVALAEDERDQRQWRGDDNDKDNGRWDNDRDDDNGRWDRDDGNGRWDRNEGHQHSAGCDHNTGGNRWRNQLVSVKVYNQRDRMVTLFLNGQYLGRVGPNSRERISLPQGYHTLTYQVGWGGRHGYETISVSAFEGQRNRLVIEGRRHGWGRNWGW